MCWCCTDLAKQPLKGFGYCKQPVTEGGDPHHSDHKLLESEGTQTRKYFGLSLFIVAQRQHSNNNCIVSCEAKTTAFLQIWLEDVTSCVWLFFNLVCLPWTWHAFLRLMVLFFAPPCKLLPSRSHWVWLIVIFLFAFFSPLSQKLTVTQLELGEAKNGTAAFFKWHKFVSLYLAHMSPAWEQREGGQLWWNDLVWIKAVSQQAPQGLILSPACLVESLSLYQPVLHYIRSFSLPCLFFRVFLPV